MRVSRGRLRLTGRECGRRGGALSARFLESARSGRVNPSKQGGRGAGRPVGVRLARPGKERGTRKKR